MPVHPACMIGSAHRQSQRDTDRHWHGEENDHGGHEASDRSHDVHHLLESRNVNGIGTLRLRNDGERRMNEMGPARNSSGQPSAPPLSAERRQPGDRDDPVGL